jgi:hypothetical protein
MSSSSSTSSFFSSSGEKALTIQYGTSIPANERAALIDQAVAVATQLSECADEQGISRGSAQICRTRAQAETREQITEIVSLARNSDGSWSWSADLDPSDRGA